MKYIFRRQVVFEYIPDHKNLLWGRVIQHRVHQVIPAFDHCAMIKEDYLLLSKFFDTVYRHMSGEDVVLEDIHVS